MDTPTITYLDNDARVKILNGVNKIYEPVRRTFGPGGGNFLTYGLYSRPYRISNDGVMCAELVELKDEAEKLAASAMQDAAKRTNLLAGDATTCTVILAGNIIKKVMPELMQSEDTAEYERAFSKVGTSRRVMDVKRELFASRDKVISSLKEKSKKVESLEELERIAIYSVEDVERGKLIADMAWKVGVDGYLDIQEGFKGEIETEIIRGSRFAAKVCAPVFVNKPEKRIMEVEDAPVLITNYTFGLRELSIVSGKLENKENPLQKLVILAPEFKHDALQAMARIDKKAQDLIYAPVKVPSLTTDQFIDVETFTGARFVNKDRGDKLENLSRGDLGFVTKLIVKDTDIREDAIVLGGKGEQSFHSTLEVGKDVVLNAGNAIEARVKMLQGQLEETREEGRKNVLRRRIAGLASNVGIIRVSADSEAETFYWKKKIEDAACACKAALQEGYVKGGGLTLKEIASELPDDDILKEALEAPAKELQENAEGIEVSDDVIDSTKGIRCAVEHAVSVTANLLTVKVIIPQEREKTPYEGYADIASAIRFYVLLQAKERGIRIDNEEEIARDTMAHHDNLLRQVID